MKNSILSTFVKLIGETAFTHKGELDYLKWQIDLIADNGFDYVKFQVLLDVSEVYKKSAEIYDDLKDNIFSYESWSRILEYASERGLGILFMPVDYKSLSLVEEHPDLIDIIEVHAIGLNDVFLLNRLNELSSTYPELIYMLGVGGRESGDIQFSSDYLANGNQILMYGFQSFPTEKEKSNLGKIKALKEAFEFPVGYADHTPWNEYDSELIQIALTMGSSFFEKHIILEEGDESRPDFYSAIGQAGIDRLKDTLRRTITYYGKSDLTSLTVDEQKYKERERKIVASRDLKKGKKIKDGDLCYKVTDANTLIAPKMIKDIYGKTTNKSLKKDTVIKLEDIQ